jgi:hypothetical protein
MALSGDERLERVAPGSIATAFVHEHLAELAAAEAAPELTPIGPACARSARTARKPVAALSRDVRWGAWHPNGHYGTAL